VSANPTTRERTRLTSAAMDLYHGNVNGVAASATGGTNGGGGEQ